MALVVLRILRRILHWRCLGRGLAVIVLAVPPVAAAAGYVWHYVDNAAQTGRFYDIVDDGAGGVIAVGEVARSTGARFEAVVARVDGNGKLLWRQAFVPADGHTGSLKGAIKLPDGDILAVGWSRDPRQTSDRGWIIRIGGDGVLRWQRLMSLPGLRLNSVALRSGPSLFGKRWDVMAVGTEVVPKTRQSRGILAFVKASNEDAPAFVPLNYFQETLHGSQWSSTGDPRESSAETLAVLDNGDMLVGGWSRGLPSLKRGPWVVHLGTDLKPKWTTSFWSWKAPGVAPGDARILRILPASKRVLKDSRGRPGEPILAAGEVQLTSRLGRKGVLFELDERSGAVHSITLLGSSSNDSLRTLSMHGAGKYLAAGVRANARPWINYFLENDWGYERVAEVKGDDAVSSAEILAGIPRGGKLLVVGARDESGSPRAWIAAVDIASPSPWEMRADRPAGEVREAQDDGGFLDVLAWNLGSAAPPTCGACYRDNREVMLPQYRDGRVEEATLLLRQIAETNEPKALLATLWGMADDLRSLNRQGDLITVLRWFLDRERMFKSPPSPKPIESSNPYTAISSKAQARLGELAVEARAELAWLVAEFGDSVAAQEYAASALAGIDRIAEKGMALAYLGRYYKTRGYLHEAEELLRKASGILLRVSLANLIEGNFDPDFRAFESIVPELLDCYRQLGQAAKEEAFLTSTIDQINREIELSGDGEEAFKFGPLSEKIRLLLAEAMLARGDEQADSRLISLLRDPNRKTPWSRIWVKVRQFIAHHESRGQSARATRLKQALTASAEIGRRNGSPGPYDYLLFGDRKTAKEKLPTGLSAYRQSGGMKAHDVPPALVTDGVLIGRQARKESSPETEDEPLDPFNGMVSAIRVQYMGSGGYFAEAAHRELGNYAEELFTAGYLDASYEFFRALAAEKSDYHGKLSALANMTEIAMKMKWDDKALESSAKGIDLAKARAEHGGTAARTLRQDMALARRMAELRVAALHQVAHRPTPKAGPPASEDSFVAGQVGRTTAAATALAQMTVRIASGSDDLSVAIRQRQEAARDWGNAEQALITAGAERRQRWQRELNRLDRKLKSLDEDITRRFPAYAQLMNALPATADQVQKVLLADEALVGLLVAEDETYLWGIREGELAFARVPIGRRALEDAVRKLRRALDPLDDKATGSLLDFPVADAHALYSALFGPLEKMLAGVNHLIVVPDGPLQSLPLSVLLTEAPRAAVKEVGEYRDLAWMGKRFSLTTLPAVSALIALRQFGKAGAGKEPFAGFGDPSLHGGGGAVRKLNAAALFSRGTVANVSEVRKLTPLPETAGELLAIADVLKADRSNVFLRDRATETMVKNMDLSRFQVLSFATHGAMGGEFPGVSEPFLVLTPPRSGSELDDGLLTASEVARLKLNANWVLLSACNTAAPDGTPGAEGLSGLASAFLYAGSRAMLVSHWAVASDAAVVLTTQIFAETAREPSIGKSEALRRAMRAVMSDLTNRQFSHPMFWAPFVVVGEGAHGPFGPN